MAREHEADNVTREVLLAVRRTFITPFDRGDIRDLITSMDDAIDQMHKTAKSITLFESPRFQPEMEDMGDIIVQMRASWSHEAVPLLRSIGARPAASTPWPSRSSALEDQSDDLHDAGI